MDEGQNVRIGSKSGGLREDQEGEGYACCDG